jgi:hypothetical protein
MLGLHWSYRQNLPLSIRNTGFVSESTGLLAQVTSRSQFKNVVAVLATLASGGKRAKQQTNYATDNNYTSFTLFFWRSVSTIQSSHPSLS